MLNYRHIDVLISILYYCNKLTTNNHSSDDSHMIYRSSSHAALPQET